MAKLSDQKKGLLLIGVGLLFLVGNGWVTVHLLTLIFSLILINYGLLKMGKHSLTDYVRAALAALKFW